MKPLIRPLTGFPFGLVFQTGHLLGEPPQKKKEPVLENGLEIMIKSEGKLTVGGSAKVTVTLKNHLKTPLQTMIPSKGMVGAIWQCSFDPPIHEEMSGPSLTLSGTEDYRVTIALGKTASFTMELKRTKKGVFMKSDLGKFGCLHGPVALPKGTKELKMSYRHQDQGQRHFKSPNRKEVKFAEKRWTGELNSADAVIKLE